MISVAVAYSYFSQKSSDEDQNSDSPNSLTDSDIAGEVDNAFLEENDEVEIGEMV